MAELIAEHPDWLDAHRARERADFLDTYGPLIHALGLEPPQRERFLAALSVREKKRAALRITAGREGWSEDSPHLASLKKDEELRQARDFGALLGAADHERFQEFERTLGVRHHVNELAAQLYATPAPLDAATAERLVQTMARHATDAAGKVDLNSVRWAQVLLATKDLLTPEQQTLFARLGNAQQQQRQLNRIVANSRPADAAP
jgi:hypothetical protein